MNMENPQSPEKERVALFVNNYSVGELRVCIKNKRAFETYPEQEEFMNQVGPKLKKALNEWSKTRYGREIFGGYSDGETIRVQTGLHEVTEEDRNKIEEMVGQINEGSL
jgi:hypothetical protein